MRTDRNNAYLADAGLLCTALIWGSGFLAAQFAMDSGLSYAMILVLRFGIAAIGIGCIAYRKLRNLQRAEIVAGVVTGGVLFLAFFLQTIGLSGTSVSNNAFLTTTNVMMVPFLQWMLWKQRPKRTVFFAAALSMLGVWLLTWSPGQGMTFSWGDAITLGCAFFFSCHILCVGYYGQHVHAETFTWLQMTVAAVLSAVILPFFPTDWAGVQWGKGLLAVIYLGAFPTCLAFFLQTWAQKHAVASKAVILLSLEGLFGCVFSVMIGYEALTWSLGIGGLVMVLAVLIAEWPERSRQPERTSVR